MKLSRKTDYGIIFLKSLSPTFKSGEFFSTSKVAKENNLPQSFMEKLAETLRKKGFIEAKRGLTGGYRLLKDPRRINLQEMVEVFEEKPFMRCLRSSDPEKHCPLVKICPAHKTWVAVHEKTKNIFRGITLAKL